MRWYLTDASALEVAKSRLTTYIVPQGEAGFDLYGRKKVTWQRDGGKIYVTCPSCGNIGHYDIEGCQIIGRGIYTSDCFTCWHCRAHSFFILDGAAAEMAEKIRKDPSSCPRCKATASRHWSEYPRGGSHFSTCGSCGISWVCPGKSYTCPKCNEERGRK